MSRLSASQHVGKEVHAITIPSLSSQTRMVLQGEQVYLGALNTGHGKGLQ